MKNKYLQNSIIWIISLALLMLSCEDFFIPDPVDPSLPKYTEKGSNFAGAIINDGVWKSHFERYTNGSDDEPIVHYFSFRDSLTVKFVGRISEEDSHMAMVFSLKNIGARKLDDLLLLNNKKFNLGKEGYGVYVVTQTNYNCSISGEGQLYFKSVKYSNNKRNIILSGTFGFDVVNPICGNHTVRFGRFDYEISDFFYN